MKHKDSSVRARINHDLKKNVEIILHELGMTKSEAINAFFAQIELNHGLPFEIKIPNKITRQTLENSQNGKDIHTVNDIKQLITELEK
jgi:DNA-damage-inducible protein J